MLNALPLCTGCVTDGETVRGTAVVEVENSTALFEPNKSRIRFMYHYSALPAFPKLSAKDRIVSFHISVCTISAGKL